MCLRAKNLILKYRRVGYNIEVCAKTFVLWFIDRNQLFAYKKKEIDYKNKDFIAWKPHVIEVAYPLKRIKTQTAR